MTYDAAVALIIIKHCNVSFINFIIVANVADY